MSEGTKRKTSLGSALMNLRRVIARREKFGGTLDFSSSYVPCSCSFARVDLNDDFSRNPDFQNPLFRDIQISGLQERRKPVIPTLVCGPNGGGRRREVGPMANSEADDPSDDSDRTKSLSFKVDVDFKKEFKGFAVAQGISMTDLLKEGFALSKKKRQK